MTSVTGLVSASRSARRWLRSVAERWEPAMGRALRSLRHQPLDRSRQIGTEHRRVVVAVIGRQPRHGCRLLFDQLRQQGGLAVSRRRDDGGDGQVAVCPVARAALDGARHRGGARSDGALRSGSGTAVPGGGCPRRQDAHRRAPRFLDARQPWSFRRPAERGRIVSAHDLVSVLTACDFHPFCDAERTLQRAVRITEPVGAGPAGGNFPESRRDAHPDRLVADELCAGGVRD